MGSIDLSSDTHGSLQILNMNPDGTVIDTSAPAIVGDGSTAITVSKSDTGAASTSKLILAANVDRKKFRVVHADSLKPNAIVSLNFNSAAAIDTQPLGGYGSYWESQSAAEAASTVNAFSAVANVKLFIVEAI
jgi:hypothetical protein